MCYANMSRFLFLRLEVTEKISFQVELTVDNEMEAREKLSSISDSFKVLQDGRAGRVPRVKKLMCK